MACDVMCVCERGMGRGQRKGWDFPSIVKLYTTEHTEKTEKKEEKKKKRKNERKQEKENKEERSWAGGRAPCTCHLMAV